MSVSGSFSFTALLNGTTINGHAAVANGPLVQRYNKTTSTYVPNFAALADNVKPYVYAHLNRSDNGVLVIPNAVTFAYNGTVLTFDGNGICTNTGLESTFKKMTKTVTIGGTAYDMPSLVIVGNLYSTSNVDNDLITISGTIEISGQSIAFSSVKCPVVIGEVEGNQFDLYITSSGDNYLTEAQKQVTLNASAMLNGALITDTSAYTFKWYKISGGGSTLLGTGASLLVDVAAVDSQMDIRCDILSGPTVVASAFASVYDATDPYIVALDVTGVTGDKIGLGQTALVTPHVKKRSTGEIVKDDSNNEKYTSFQFYITNNAGAAFVLTGQTQTTFTAPSVSITHADLLAAGGAINGYLTEA